jgi:hypothetical protein
MLGETFQGPTKTRITVIGSNITRRLKHKLSCGVPWVGNNQAGPTPDQFTMQNDVQIDRSRIPTLSSLTPQFGFNTLQRGQNLSRRSLRVKSGDGIQKRLLSCGTADWRRLEQTAGIQFVHLR